MSLHPANSKGSEIEERITLINESLIQYLKSYPYQTVDLFEAANYSVSSPGHRWRPILFLKIYEILSHKKNSYDVLPLSCAIEILHTASIILDDLPSMDDATLRRGKIPCHLEFGQPRAILAASWLCDVAQRLVHEFQTLNKSLSSTDLDELLRFTKNEMMQGQVLDLGQEKLTEDEIIEMYRQKSGALYAFSASVPAHLLGLTEVAEHLNIFGNYLGVAYQISDDIHDCTDTAEELGKDVRQDCDKNTIPQLYGVRKAIELRNDYKNRAIAELKGASLLTDSIVDLVDRICF